MKSCEIIVNSLVNYQLNGGCRTGPEQGRRPQLLGSITFSPKTVGGQYQVWGTFITWVPRICCQEFGCGLGWAGVTSGLAQGQQVQHTVGYL